MAFSSLSHTLRIFQMQRSSALNVNDDDDDLQSCKHVCLTNSEGTIENVKIHFNYLFIVQLPFDEYQNRQNGTEIDAVFHW